ncbi:MAG: bifunctional DNA-formamidopyrimidine glycosylase/DNA-(apurinic or apyrimidinic site) lyase [Dehalococcoidales bacterium]|nr:bifunctional DNA-formamidopyrimidine glycosylase/DNA-(apurinic or apyrimidinic site) lyase [Dehalococcoidales bacterium]
MPELPEVETVKNELTPHIIGRRVTGITLNWEGMVLKPSVEEFRSCLIGQEITRLSRRGKYLIFHLGNGTMLIIHLRMTGSLLLKPTRAEPEKFVRAIIHLDGILDIHFRDPRKFGVMWFTRDLVSLETKLGTEPLEEVFTPALLAELLANRKAPIKALLLEQDLIAGIGNMYADESLFSAGIHPSRPGGSLTMAEVSRLYQGIRQVLSAAIDHKGASVDTYYRPGGEEGTAHFQFRVAHRLGGKLCPVCGTPVERITVRNRGTYFCPGCQPQDKGKDGCSHGMDEDR